MQSNPEIWFNKYKNENPIARICFYDGSDVVQKAIIGQLYRSEQKTAINRKLRLQTYGYFLSGGFGFVNENEISETEREPTNSCNASPDFIHAETKSV